MATLVQIAIARRNGILMPVRASRAAKQAGIPYYVACAFLMQETGGGQNIYGHDVGSNGIPRPFWGAGEVTEENYKWYLHERDMYKLDRRFNFLGPRRQGVGPLQLTWHTYQDEADTLGGCWNPQINMYVGFKIIVGHYRSNGNSWREAARAYSGKDTYADEMVRRFAFWLNLVGRN